MKNMLVLLPLVCLLCFRAEAQELKCEDFVPKIKSLKVMIMAPVKRDKVWLEGSPASTFQTSCAPDGFKTEEAEYQQKSLVSKKSFVHKSREEVKSLCKGVKQEEGTETPAGEDSRADLDAFCKEHLGKGPEAVMIYDAAAAPDASGASNLIRQTFRFRNSKGLPVEDRQFDIYMGPEARIEYKYGGGELAERTEYGPDDAKLKQEVRSFDKKANTRSVSLFNEHGQILKKTVSEYRKDGTLSKETRIEYNAGEQVLFKYELACDDKGSPKTEAVYEGGETPAYEYHYAYKYDAKGNWTEEWKTKFLIYGGKKLEDKTASPRVTKRELAYY